MGVSRLGKTVLWAARRTRAWRPCSWWFPATTAVASIRRDWGETLDDMAQNFPWQFAGNLQKWVGKWNDLPVDQHMLIAFCGARRLVYVNGGLTDQWSDPKGEFLAMAAAGPVYRLLGCKDLGVTELPPLDAADCERRSGLSVSQRWPHGRPGGLGRRFSTWPIAVCVPRGPARE